MRSLLLRDAHAARGARFAAAGGAEVVAAYGDVGDEVRAARTAAVLADRSHRGRLALTGADRVSFLQGQSSNDVQALSPGQGHYTTFLTGKGKMRGDAVVHAFADHLRLGVEGDAAEAIRRHLESFVILEEVRIEDRSAATVELGVYGPGAGAALAAAGLAVPALGSLAEHHFVTVGLGGGAVTVASERPTGDPGFTLVAEAALGRALFAALSAHAVLAGQDALEVLRVEAGIPRFGAELDPETIPLEAGLTHAISYTKGCYTGNEVIARIKTYGHVNRALAGIRLAGKEAVAAGDAVLAGDKPVGRVTTSVWSPTLSQPIALAMLRREAAAPGLAVEVEHGSSRCPGEVVDLPFVRRTG